MTVKNMGQFFENLCSTIALLTIVNSLVKLLQTFKTNLEVKQNFQKINPWSIYADNLTIKKHGY